MLSISRTLQTLMLLMAFAVMTQRVLTPFLVPPLILHADGTLEICSWQGSSQRLVFNQQGERVDSLQPDFSCPQCTSAPATHQVDTGLAQGPAAGFIIRTQGVEDASLSAYLHPPSRAPPQPA